MAALNVQDGSKDPIPASNLRKKKLRRRNKSLDIMLSLDIDKGLLSRNWVGSCYYPQGQKCYGKQKEPRLRVLLLGHIQKWIRTCRTCIDRHVIIRQSANGPHLSRARANTTLATIKYRGMSEIGRRKTRLRSRERQNRRGYSMSTR